MVISQAYENAKLILKNADIESFLADSLILLCHILNISKEKYILIKNDEMSYEDYSRYIELIKKRALKHPVKYLTGICEFMGIDFIVKPGVLIPRPETEILVEKALSLVPIASELMICDLCCGSGCIGISLLSFLKSAFLEAYDISDTAIQITLENAKSAHVSERTNIIKKDILTCDINTKFDLIVSNPPYISTEEYNTLMDDVRLYEPEIALHSPCDDLKFYRRIIEKYTKNLKEKGYLLFEVGYNQSEAVKNLLMQNNSFTNIEITKDLNRIPRVVSAQKL